MAAEYHIDVGNLCVLDSADPGIDPSTSSESYDQQCLEKGAQLIQALADHLFSLPSVPDKHGRLVTLPAPTTPLPREKPLPKPRPPTKWETFAQAKGIKKRKRSTIDFDDQTGEWRRRHGYQRVDDERDIPIIEAKDTDEPGEDPFTNMRSEKKARVAKQEKNRLENLKNTLKVSGKTALPSTVQLAATALPITGSKDAPKKPSKYDITDAAGFARTATASLGKFDKQLPGEKPAKHPGKHRKFLPVVGQEAEERQQCGKILDKVLARHNHDILDVSKAVSAHNATEQNERAQRNLSGGGKKRKFGSGGGGGGGKKFGSGGGGGKKFGGGDGGDGKRFGGDGGKRFKGGDGGKKKFSGGDGGKKRFSGGDGGKKRFNGGDGSKRKSNGGDKGHKKKGTSFKGKG